LALDGFSQVQTERVMQNPGTNIIAVYADPCALVCLLLFLALPSTPSILVCFLFGSGFKNAGTQASPNTSRSQQAANKYTHECVCAHTHIHKSAQSHSSHFNSISKRVTMYIRRHGTNTN
jgi:hypothetical protein